MGPCLVPFFEEYRPAAHGSPDPGVVVRRATAEDVPGMAAVARTRGPQPPELDGRVAAWAVDDERRLTVAVAPGAQPEVVGWGMVARWTGHDDAPDGWYVAWLVVHPQWRRRGVADRLLGDLRAWTAARAERLLSVVNVQNRASLDLHARHGFREVARGAGFAGVTFTGGVGVLLASAGGETAG